MSDGYRKAAATDLKDVAVGMRATADATRDLQVPQLDEKLVDKIRTLPGVSAGPRDQLRLHRGGRQGRRPDGRAAQHHRHHVPLARQGRPGPPKYRSL
ncbi:hypothetical protein ACU686_05855 [Yinghuangia aomiensis]